MVTEPAAATEQVSANPVEQQSAETPEQVQASIISAFTDEKAPQAVDSLGNVSEAPASVPEIVPTFTPSPVWVELQKRLSSEEKPWSLPAEVAAGNFGEGKTEFDALLEHIYQNTDFSSVAPQIDDPFIQNYLAAKAQDNFNPQEWIQSQAGATSMFDLQGKDFIREYYMQYKLQSDANPDGYSQEDIDTYLNSKNRIELDKESLVLKKVLKDEMAEQDRQHLKTIRDRDETQFQAQEATNQQSITNFVKAHTYAREFFGIEFSEAERTQFFNDLPGLFKRDPQTRMSKMDALLQSESDILKLAALVWKGEAGIKGHVSHVKETVKAELEQKLGVSNKPQAGTLVTPRPFNPNNLV